MPKLTMLPLHLLMACGALQPAPRADKPTSIYWSSDSILNMRELWLRTRAAMPNASTATWLEATYGGNKIGTSLMHLADETYAWTGSAWEAQTRRIPLSDFYALVLEAGRNDADGTMPKAIYADAWDKAIAQGLKYFPRVIVSTCPKYALDDLTAWRTDQNELMSDYNGGAAPYGYHSAITAVWDRWGVTRYDTYLDFQALVTAGTRTVADLMRDNAHPTMVIGAQRMADEFARLLASYTPPSAVAVPNIQGRVVNYLFGQPTAGTWTMQAGGNPVMSPGVGPVANLTQLADQVSAASGVGAKVRFPAIKARQIWFHWIHQAANGGNGTVYVDRGTAQEVSSAFYTTNAGLPTYPGNLLVGYAQLDPAVAHTVEVETTTANPVAVLGITAVGVVN